MKINGLKLPYLDIFQMHIKGHERGHGHEIGQDILDPHHQ